MKAKVWLSCWLVLVLAALGIAGYMVYKIDPYIHYHLPDTERYYYVLDNERSQNDGICRHYAYDALITGTSMTENFRTTEMDELFGCHSIKVAFSGGTYYEINRTVETALKHNADLKTVIRCLDMGRFLDPEDWLRNDMGTYPSYLYDDDPFNDVEYLLNRDTVFGRAWLMTIITGKWGGTPGITSFDDYCRWQQYFTFGPGYVCPDGLADAEKEQTHLTEEERERIKKNFDRNVTGIADQYPDVDFYYFYSPYSVATWYDWKMEGNLVKMLEAEAYITELILPHKNIRLFSFNNRTDITTALNNYKDGPHYGSWINSLMLKWMHDGQYQLTEENYREYLQQEYDFYTTFDYSSVNGQEDYEADFYAAALLNEELTGAKPLDILNDGRAGAEILGAETLTEQGQSVSGLRFTVDMDAGYNYLCFTGQKITDQGNLMATVYDGSGAVIAKVEANAPDLDGRPHQVALDLSTVKGTVTVELNAETASPDYQFSNIFMY